MANGAGTEMKIPEQIPFATGSCRQFKRDVLVEWKAPMLNNAAQSFVLCKISSSKFSKGSLSCSVKRLKSSIISERETFPPPPSVGVASVLVKS